MIVKSDVVLFIWNQAHLLQIFQPCLLFAQQNECKSLVRYKIYACCTGVLKWVCGDLHLNSHPLKKVCSKNGIPWQNLKKINSNFSLNMKSTQ